MATPQRWFLRVIAIFYLSTETRYNGTTMENNMSLYEVVDFAALKLNISSKSALWFAIKDAIESSVVAESTPTRRVHVGGSTCISCEG
jgi:hypothetical protein